MNELVLGIDVGSTSIRCLVTDLEGRPVSLCSKPWSSYTPAELAPLGKEFDPEELWKLICETARKALWKAKEGKLAGISATAQREGAVFLNREGREIYAGPNFDLRALTEGALMDQKLGKDIHSLTGHLPSFLFTPAKLKWFKSHKPEVYDEIAAVLSIDEWVIYRLTGEKVGEVCSLGELGLIDIHTRHRSAELEERLDVPEIYPRLFEVGAEVGKVRKGVASEIELPEEVPVVLGAPDTQCGLLGLGLQDPGEVGIVAGWSCPCCLLTAKPFFDPRLWTGLYLFEQSPWVLESNAGELGGSWRWLTQVLGKGGKEMGKEEAPSSGTLSFLVPRVMNMNRLGMWWGGFIFPLPPNFAGINKASLLKAALESFCFTIKSNLLQLEEVSGIGPSRIAIGGGLTQNQTFIQTLPQALGKPVFLPQIREISALGAAMCAAAGSRKFSSLEEAQKAMRPEFDFLQPDPVTSQEYADEFERWSRFAKMLEELPEV